MTTITSENIEEMSQNQRILICLQVLDIFKRISKERTQEEINLIMGFLNGFSSIKEVSKDFQDQPSFLAKCAQSFQYHCFRRGDLIADKGSQSENFIIILKGKANIYEPKSSKEFKKIKSLQAENTPRKLTRMQSKRFTRFRDEDNKTNGNESPTRLFSRTSLDIDSATQKESMWEFPTQKSMKKKSRDLVRESSDNFERMSMSSKVSFHLNLDKKPSEDVQVSFDDEEQLIFKNAYLKDKYFEGDVCILRSTQSVAFGAVINEKCFQQSYRSLKVFVAAEDTHVIQMNRDSFTQVFQEELESRRQKKKYFTYFFDDIPDFPKILYNYIREKTYVINDKIFDQEDDADGLYFIKSGEVKFSTAQLTDTKLKTQESETPKKTSPSPLRKDVVGTEWLTNRRKTSPDDRENLFGFKAAHRKTSAILGTLGGLHSFGEEGFFTDDKKRAYTASAATNKLEVYFLGLEYFATVRILHPQIVKILESKTKSLNNWLLKRTKEIKGVQSIVGQIFDNPSQARFMRSRRGNSNLLKDDFSGRLALSNPTQPRLVISNSMRKNFLAKNLDINFKTDEELEKSPQAEKLSLATRNRSKKPRIKSENRLFSNPGSAIPGSRKQRNQSPISPSPPPTEKKEFSLVQRFRRKDFQRHQVLEPISPIKKIPESPPLVDSVETTPRYKLGNPAYFHETAEMSFQRPSITHRVALPTYEYIGLSERSFSHDRLHSHRNSTENISLDHSKDFINYHVKQQFNQVVKTPLREPRDPIPPNSDSLPKKKTLSRSIHHMFRLKPRHNSNLFSHMYRDTSPS